MSLKSIRVIKGFATPTLRNSIGGRALRIRKHIMKIIESSLQILKSTVQNMNFWWARRFTWEKLKDWNFLHIVNVIDNFKSFIILISRAKVLFKISELFRVLSTYNREFLYFSFMCPLRGVNTKFFLGFFALHITRYL